MSRLATIDPSSASIKAKEIFDGPLKGKHFNIFKAMANSPAALGAYLGASGALAGGLLSKAEQETVQLAIGEANKCGYCVAAHTAIGKSAGLSEAETVSARRGAVATNQKLDALAKFALAIHENRGVVSDADVAAFRKAGYSDGHIAEVVANYALAIYTNYFNHVNRTEVDFPAVAKI